MNSPKTCNCGGTPRWVENPACIPTDNEKGYENYFIVECRPCGKTNDASQVGVLHRTAADAVADWNSTAGV